MIILTKMNIHDITLSDYQKYYLLMAEDKKKRIDQFVSDDDKKRSVAAELLIRQGISDISHLNPEEAVIRIKENGKPYSVNTNIHFSVSHSEDYAVCVFSYSQIGVDIEKIHPIHSNVINKVCSEDECDYVFGHGLTKNSLIVDQDCLKRFFTVWTAKEAYLKFSGTGIVDDLRIVNIPWHYVKTECFEDYVISIYSEDNECYQRSF